MKSTLLKLALAILILYIPSDMSAQDFQGRAVYLQKAKMKLGSWGARMSEAQKNQIKARLKNRLEKTYILTFNKQESTFKEDEKIDAISGATDSWGGYFSRGYSYRNTKESKIVQSQEFYGKKFLVKDDDYKISWEMGSETKEIGQYTVYKATATIPSDEVSWYSFNWSDLRPNKDKETGEVKERTTVVEAWYTPQIPVSHGPGEYWGLPGLILEVKYGDTILLCSEVSINSNETVAIKAPEKGEEITKKDYTATIRKKMVEMRENRMGRRRSR
jgi:GLPGLI family protein